jgi:thiamine transport system ATP-binding protein
LNVREATVVYRDDEGATSTAIESVSVSVAEGSVLGILGPSGSGKSTLLRAIAGLEPLDSGVIEWNGEDLARTPVHKRGFAVMFQDGQLFPHRTVFDNIAYPLRLARSDSSEVSDLLELVGLDGFGSRSIASLSGGEQQRVALARSLAAHPRLLLLDEPLSALDRELRERLAIDLRRILSTTRTTALFVTHDHGEAFAIADNVAILERGALVQVGTPEAVWRSPATATIARFLGYSSVLDAGSAALLGLTGAVALRPSALVVSREGIPVTITRVVPGVDGDRVRVAVDGVGELDAVGVDAAPGNAHVRVDDRGVAKL